MSRTVQFGDIKVRCNEYGDGEHGFFYANSKNRDELEIVAGLTEQIPEVTKATITWVPEQTLTRQDGSSRISGGYWKMIAEF